MIKASIIGVSGFGAFHYHDLLRHGGTIRIVAATIPNQQMEAEKCSFLRARGTEIYADYREMLTRHAGDLDLCLIPTGIGLHEEMTIEALQAGANVLVEKPAAGTIQEVRSMARAERKSDRFVAVGFQNMHAPDTFWLKESLLDGAIGEVRSIKCAGLWPRLTSYYQRNNWAGKMRSGGRWVLDSPFNNAMAHQLNMCLFFAGSDLHRSASVVSVQAELYRAQPIEGPDTAAIRIQTESRVPILFVCSHSCRRKLNPFIIVEGTKGRMGWTFEQAWIERKGRIDTVECVKDTPLRDRMIGAILKRLQSPEQFVCNLDIAGCHTLVVNGAHASSPVHAIPEEFVSRKPEERNMKTIIHGIDRLVLSCMREEALFSETGAAWGVPGAVIPMLGFEQFDGVRSLTPERHVEAAAA